MRRCVKTGVMFSMMEMLTGDRQRAAEAAKRLIAVPSEIDPEFLMMIVRDPEYKLWSKVMALYVLGFLPPLEAAGHYQILREALANRGMNVQLRAHAAEALGNLRDQESTAVLRERLLDEHELKSVRKWCIYALGEVGSAEALDTLKSFAKTQPRGVLAQELASAGI